VKDELIIEKVNEMKSDYYLDLIDAIVFRNIQEREEMETFMDINMKIKRKIDTIEYVNLEARIPNKKVFSID